MVSRINFITLVVVFLVSNTSQAEDLDFLERFNPTLYQKLNSLSFGQQRNSRQVEDCPDDQISFEMVTGYVYTAPADMLDSQPGTLMLTDCIDTCRKNSSCQSINYETGLCVLFASNADGSAGKFSVFDGIKLLRRLIPKKIRLSRVDSDQFYVSLLDNFSKQMSPRYYKKDWTDICFLF